MILISFPEGHGELELEERDFTLLLEFARRGVRILVPVLYENSIVFINVIDIKRKSQPQENIDYQQLSKLGVATFSR